MRFDTRRARRCAIRGPIPALLLLVALIIAVPAQAEWLQGEQAIMGTRCVVELWSDDAAKGEAGITSVFDDMKRIDRLMSTWKEDTEISEVNREAALQVLVEGNAVAKQVLDAVTGFVRQEMRDLLIDNASTGADRICRVRVRAVALGDCRGDARLRPQTRCTFAEARRRDDGDGEGRKLQCGKETSKTCPNDDDATACAPRRKMPH